MPQALILMHMDKFSCRGPEVLQALHLDPVQTQGPVFMDRFMLRVQQALGPSGDDLMGAARWHWTLTAHAFIYADSSCSQALVT